MLTEAEVDLDFLRRKKKGGSTYVLNYFCSENMESAVRSKFDQIIWIINYIFFYTDRGWGSDWAHHPKSQGLPVVNGIKCTYGGLIMILLGSILE